MPDFNLSSCKRISRATPLLPVWLHDATTIGCRICIMCNQISGVSYEELCDTNPSKPTRAPWHARWTPSANGWSLLIVRDASVAYGALRFRKSLGLQKNVLSTRQEVVACGILEQVAGFGRSAYPGICPNPKRPRVVPVIVALRQWGEIISSPRRETLSGSGQTHGKPFECKTQRERENAYGERSGTGLLRIE